ncbi:hypothetical protein CRM22_000459, partial [Opisthorchis felineus]
YDAHCVQLGLMAASVAKLASTDFVNQAISDNSETAIGQSDSAPIKPCSDGSTQLPNSHSCLPSVPNSHWLFDWLDSVVFQSLQKFLDHSKFSVLALRSLVRHLGFPTRLACALYHYLPDIWLQLPLSSNQNYPGVLQRLVKRSGTVARPARPAHPNSRPIALLNTAAVEQLVRSTTTASADPMDSLTPRVDSPQTPTSSTGALHQNGLGSDHPTSANDLLTDLVLVAARGGDEPPPLPTEAGSGKGGFYVTKQLPESTMISDISPPESVENSRVGFERNKMYATFCKRPSPEFSDKLPVVSSPKRVPSPVTSAPTQSPKSSIPVSDIAGGVVSLRSEFEKRKRSRSSLPAVQVEGVKMAENHVPPPGTTTWAVTAVGSTKTSCRKSSAPSNSVENDISSTSGISDHGEKPVSRSSAAALRLSLDQRRRAIEMGRQRALIATNKAAAQRHHAAFQRLLQNEQRRRGKKPDAPEVSENEATSVEPTSQCQNSIVPSSPTVNPTPEAAVAFDLNNGTGDTAPSNLEQGTDIEDEFSVQSCEAQKPSFDQQSDTADDQALLEDHTGEKRVCPADVSSKTASSPEPIDCTELSQIYPDESIADQHSLPGRIPSDSSHSGSEPADFTVPSVTSDLANRSESWFHSVPSRQVASNVRRPRQSTPHAGIDRTSGDYSTRDPPIRRVRHHSPRPAPSDEYSHLYPVNVQQPSSRPHVRHSHKSSQSPTRLRHSTRSASHRNNLTSQSLTSEMIRRAGRLECPGFIRPSRHHHLATSTTYDSHHGGHIWGPEEDEYAPYEELYDYGDEEDEDASASESDAEVEVRSNYSRGRWESDQYSERSMPISRAYPNYAQSHLRASHHRRRMSPVDFSSSGRCHRRADRHDANAIALEQLNRNLIGLQTGLERLLAAGPNTPPATEGTRFEGQQASAQLTSSHTSLAGTTRATWSERPKLRDLSKGRLVDSNLEHVGPTLPIHTSAAEHEDTSFISNRQASESQVPQPSAPPKSSASCAFSVDMSSTSFVEPKPETDKVSTPNAVQSSKEEPALKGPENTLFFIAFDEPDPQRTQRKCDQLEARRAAEKALVAQQLQTRRSQEREVKLAIEQAQQERRANEREKREAILQAYKEKRDTDSNSPRPSELYPVRPGSAALSRSEANIAASPRDRRAGSQSVAPSKRGPRQPSRNTRPAKPSDRRKSLTKSSTSLHSSSAALRGNADGEAVETSDGDIESDETQKKGRTNGARLPSGLSLSSLHRLGCTDSPSSGPGLQVPSSTQPKLFVKPKAKSNRMVIVNAIGHACLAGAVNEPMKQATLKELAATEGTHFMILFRDSRCQYRAVYSFDLELEELRLICGTGPRRITHEMANRFFKYNSGGKHFTEITSTNHLSPVVDAITIHEALWSKANGQAAALNLLSGRS